MNMETDIVYTKRGRCPTNTPLPNPLPQGERGKSGGRFLGSGLPGLE